jgi:hypothetical protein
LGGGFGHVIFLLNLSSLVFIIYVGINVVWLKTVGREMSGMLGSNDL